MSSQMDQSTAIHDLIKARTDMFEAFISAGSEAKSLATRRTIKPSIETESYHVSDITISNFVHYHPPVTKLPANSTSIKQKHTHNDGLIVTNLRPTSNQYRQKRKSSLRSGYLVGEPQTRFHSNIDVNQCSAENIVYKQPCKAEAVYNKVVESKSTVKSPIVLNPLSTEGNSPHNQLPIMDRVKCVRETRDLIPCSHGFKGAGVTKSCLQSMMMVHSFPYTLNRSLFYLSEIFTMLLERFCSFLYWVEGKLKISL